jgi:hypothetical protein
VIRTFIQKSSFPSELNSDSSPLSMRYSFSAFLSREQAFLEDDFGHPPGSLAHDLRAMDFMSAGVMEFFKLLRIGEVVITAQDFILYIPADHGPVFLDELFPEFSGELVGLEAYFPGIGKVIPFPPHEGAQDQYRPLIGSTAAVASQAGTPGQAG